MLKLLVEFNSNVSLRPIFERNNRVNSVRSSKIADMRILGKANTCAKAEWVDVEGGPNVLRLVRSRNRVPIGKNDCLGQ